MINVVDDTLVGLINLTVHAGVHLRIRIIGSSMLNCSLGSQIKWNEKFISNVFYSILRICMLSLKRVYNLIEISWIISWQEKSNKLSG